MIKGQKRLDNDEEEAHVWPCLSVANEIRHMINVRKRNLTLHNRKYKNLSLQRVFSLVATKVDFTNVKTTVVVFLHYSILARLREKKYKFSRENCKTFLKESLEVFLRNSRLQVILRP